MNPPIQPTAEQIQAASDLLLTDTYTVKSVATLLSSREKEAREEGFNDGYAHANKHLDPPNSLLALAAYSASQSLLAECGKAAKDWPTSGPEILKRVERACEKFPKP